MHKLLQKVFWWTPVLIAATVGLLLYFIDGMNFVVVWRDEALIAGFCCAYGWLLRMIPVDSGTGNGVVVPDKKISQIASQPAQTIEHKRKFLGNRYPAGHRPGPTARTGR